MHAFTKKIRFKPFIKQSIFLCFLCITSHFIKCYSLQAFILDKIIARVEEEYILLSDLESNYLAFKSAQPYSTNLKKSEVLDSLINSKILILKAKENNFKISSSDIDSQVNAKISMISEKIGGHDKVESYFKKSILDLKNYFRELLESQLLQEKQKEKILSDLQVTPLEVYNYFESSNKNSRPYLNVDFTFIEIYKDVTIDDITKNDLLKVFTNYVTSYNALNTSSSILENRNDELWVKYGNNIQYGIATIALQEKTDFESFLPTLVSVKVNSISNPVITNIGILVAKILEKNKDSINFEYILIKFENLIDAKTKIYEEMINFSQRLLHLNNLSEEDIKLKANDSGYKTKIHRKIPLSELPINAIYAFDDGKLVENNFFGPFFEKKNGEEIKILFFTKICHSRYADIGNEMEELVKMYTKIKREDIIEKEISKYKNEYDIYVDDRINDDFL